jgi:hypothetical protein
MHQSLGEIKDLSFPRKRESMLSIFAGCLLEFIPAEAGTGMTLKERPRFTDRLPFDEI